MARTLSHADKRDWLMLCRSGGVGPITFFKLLRRFGTARRAWEELPRLAREAGDEQRWRRCRPDQAEAELDALAAIGAHLLARDELGYPMRLAEIADPPPLITVRGRIEALDQPGVALVGARNASANGRLLAKGLAGDLAEAGLVLVSGLARGIDTAAHEGALVARGTTVAVIAAGVDIAYPAENAELMERIAATGAVVSERPLGAAPQARHFPRRNRIIAGLALGIVVVEAAPKSGSLITARLAAEQGREVMAVPGSPLDPRHRGTNRLLRDGATLVENAADVQSALGPIATPPPPARSAPGHRRPAAPARASDSDAREGNGAASVSATVARPRQESGAVAPASGDPPDLASRIDERLGPEPLLVDELIRQCHASPAEVQRALLELELSGRVQRHPGNRVALASL